jgi:hypothetical protein
MLAIDGGQHLLRQVGGHGRRWRDSVRRWLWPRHGGRWRRAYMQL